MKIVILSITLIGIMMMFVLPHIDVLRQDSRMGNKANNKSSGMIRKVIKNKDEDIDTNIISLERARNITVENEKQTTMLHKIVHEGEIDDINKVLNKGTPINIQNKNGHTALHIAAMLSRYDVIKFLINKGADPGIEDNNGDLAIDFVSNIPKNSKIINLLKSKAAK